VDGEAVCCGDRGQALHSARVEDDRLDGLSRRTRLVEARPVDLSRAGQVIPEHMPEPAPEIVVEVGRDVGDAIVPV
jgi:hypothetical protein